MNVVGVLTHSSMRNETIVLLHHLHSAAQSPASTSWSYFAELFPVMCLNMLASLLLFWYIFKEVIWQVHMECRCWGKMASSTDPSVMWRLCGPNEKVKTWVTRGSLAANYSAWKCGRNVIRQERQICRSPTWFGICGICVRRSNLVRFVLKIASVWSEWSLLVLSAWMICASGMPHGFSSFSSVKTFLLSYVLSGH